MLNSLIPSIDKNKKINKGMILLKLYLLDDEF
jgi:hypothetical protein